MIGIEKPILLDLPESFETERLILRAHIAGDGQAVNAALVESIHNLKQWLPMAWTQNVQTETETEELVRRWAILWLTREDLRFGLYRKSDGLYVGGCGLHRPDWEVMRFEIGYWVRASLEGQGYVSEAVSGVTSFAFNVISAERVELRCDSLNDRSIAVARRAGYILEGSLRNNYENANGVGLRDTLVFSVLRAEFSSVTLPPKRRHLMPPVEKPILLDFPDSFETERLLIRAPRIGDGQILNHAIRESLPNLKKWMPWAQKMQTPQETEEIIRRTVARWIAREDLWMLLFRKSDGLFVGRSGLHNIDWNTLRFEIGYWVRTSLEGQGYIGEAVTGITAFAFATFGAERVEIRCDSLNERSAAVARRAGYELDATLRNNDTSPDRTVQRDIFVFSMLRAEFLQRKQASQTEKT